LNINNAPVVYVQNFAIL